MFYTNFDEHITRVYKVVIKNWPLKKFCKPSDIGSRNELEVVINAFRNGAARFKKLTDEEYELWEQGYFQEEMEQLLDEPTGGYDSVTPLVASEDVQNTSGLPSASGTLLDDRATPLVASEDVQNTSGLLSASDTLLDDRAASGTSLPINSASAGAPDELSSMQPSLDPTFSVINMQPAGRKRPALSDEDLRPGAKRVALVATVSSANGAPLSAPKKQRKVRSDKGKKRGPRGGVDVPAVTPDTRACVSNIPIATSVSLPAPPGAPSESAHAVPTPTSAAVFAPNPTVALTRATPTAASFTTGVTASSSSASTSTMTAAATTDPSAATADPSTATALSPALSGPPAPPPVSTAGLPATPLSARSVAPLADATNHSHEASHMSASMCP
jgi:hypothetical protein